MKQIHERLIDNYNDETAFGAGEYTLSKAMGKMVSPWLQLSLAFATQLTIDLINISIIGRVGDTVALAAVSLGNIIIIMFVMSVMQGMNTALETLVSQAYGAGEMRLCGEHLNRMRLILLIMFIPVCLTLTFSEQILLFLRQDPEVSRVAAQYIIFQLPGLFLFALFEANRLFLNSMKETQQATTILLIGLPMHVGICYYFVHVLNYGVIGLAFAINITYAGFLLAITLYCVFTRNSKIREAWVTMNSDSLEGWTGVLELGIPGVCVYFIDFGSFEAIALMSGLIGIVELSTMGIVLIANQIFTCTAYGM